MHMQGLGLDYKRKQQAWPAADHSFSPAVRLVHSSLEGEDSHVDIRFGLKRLVCHLLFAQSRAAHPHPPSLSAIAAYDLCGALRRTQRTGLKVKYQSFVCFCVADYMDCSSVEYP
jgi:hypothetical protein